MPDDAQLLRRYLQDRSEAAFAAVVRAHIDFVHGCALRLVGGDAHLAEDVTQAVFTRMGRAAPALVEHPALKGWLYTTTRHVAASVVRSERRRHAREQKAHAMNELVNQPGAEPNWAELRPVIDDAFARLTAWEREVVFLRFYEGKDYAEIGARISATADAARRRVDRALEKMRAFLASRGVGSSSAALAAAMTAQAAVPAPAALVTTVTGVAFAANAAPGGGVAFLTLMSMNKLQTGIAAALLIGALSFTAYEFRRAAAAEESETAARSELAAQANALAAAQNQVAEATQRTAALRRALDEAARANAGPSASAGAPPRTTVNPLTKAQMAEAGREFMRGHPEARALLARYTRTEAIRGLAPFFKARGMTPEQITAFQDAVEPWGEFTFGQSQPVAGYSMTLALSEEPLPPAQRDERIRAALGEEGFAAYRQFKEESARLGPARDEVASLAGDLCWTQEPLSTAQAEQLVQIVAQGSPDFQAGKRVNLLKLEWSEVSDQARRILTPAQWRMWEENRQAFVNERALNQAERAAEGAWLRARREKK